MCGTGFGGEHGRKRGRAGICLHIIWYGSAKGAKLGREGIEAMGGIVRQEGRTDIAGAIPIERLEDALHLIRVFKVPLRNPKGYAAAWFQSPPEAENRFEGFGMAGNASELKYGRGGGREPLQVRQGELGVLDGCSDRDGRRGEG